MNSGKRMEIRSPHNRKRTAAVAYLKGQLNLAKKQPAEAAAAFIRWLYKNGKKLLAKILETLGVQAIIEFIKWLLRIYGVPVP